MVEPLGSDVPLEEDILKVARQFFPLFSEWAADNFRRIVRNSTSAGTSTLYIVPENKTLFITAVHVYIANDTAPNARGIISIGNTTGSGVGETLLNITTTAASGSEGGAYSFNHLVKVESGEIVQAKEISSNSSSIGFIGFEIDKKISVSSLR